MMWKELLLAENVVQNVFCCFLLVMYYPSSRVAHIFSVLNDAYVKYNCNVYDYYYYYYFIKN